MLILELKASSAEHLRRFLRMNAIKYKEEIVKDEIMFTISIDSPTDIWYTARKFQSHLHLATKRTKK